MTLVFLLASIHGLRALHAGDCNENTVDDAVEIAAGTVDDCNANGIPDECDLQARVSFQDLTPLPLPGAALAVEHADFNGDGAADLAAVSDSDHLTVFLNEGGGAFPAAQLYVAPPGASLLAAGDVDADGAVDIAVASHDAMEVAVYFNPGDGRLGEPVRISLVRQPLDLELVDVTGDARLDICLAQRYVRGVTVVRNVSGREFEGVEAVWETRRFPWLLSAADFDGDGGVDLAIASGAQERSLFGDTPFEITTAWNDGDGSFTEGAVLDRAQEVRALAHGDFSGDGVPDILYSTVSLFASFLGRIDNRGSRAFASPRITDPETHGELLATFDLNTDGRLDVLVATEEAGLEILHNSPAGFLSGGTVNLLGTLAGLAAADLDGDGDDDLALALASGIGVRLNEDHSLPQGHQEIRFRRIIFEIAVADLDGDGRKDFVATELDGAAVIFGWHSENETWKVDQLCSGSNAKRLALADLDADARPDVVVNHYSGNVSGFQVLWNEGGRTFTSHRVFDANRFDNEFVGTVTADVTGDGRPDVVATDRVTRDLKVFENAGAREFLPPREYPVIGRPLDLVMADVNRDGRVDAVYGRSLPEGIGVLLNRGAGAFEPAPNWDIVMPDNPIGLRLGDLDGDRYLDLVACGDRVTFFRNVGGTGFELLHEVETDAAFPVLGDLDLDGDVDVVTTAPATIYLNDGRGRFEEFPMLLPGGSVLGQITPIDDDDELPELILTGSGYISIFRNTTVPPHSLDLDQNGIPDECEASAFRRGDTDGDGHLRQADGISVLNYLFASGSPPICLKSADANDDGRVNMADGIAILAMLFAGAGPLPPPSQTCGPDPTPDGLSCALPECS